MSYEFIIDGETYTGNTTPNSALMQIYQPKQKRMVAAFSPESASLFSHRATGAWSAIHPETCLTLLEKIQPQVLAACKQRIMHKLAS